MNFLQIQNAVLSDRFNEAHRSDARDWINHRYAWIWALEDWTFKAATATVTVTNGSNVVTGLPSDMGTVTLLQRSNGDQLRYMPPDEFYGAYYDTTDSSTGYPEAYTIVNGAFTVGPVSNETSTTYRVVYERELAHFNAALAVVTGPMTADTDVPMLPTGFHFALVHGGASEGLKLQNDPTWQAFEQDFQESIKVMRAQYLTDQRWSHGQFGAYPDAIGF